ncbi:pyridine nucleotide-disulfide oxidoreductase [Cooperia oncophora]
MVRALMSVKTPYASIIRPSSNANDIRYRDDDFYRDNHILIKTGTKVGAIDTKRHSVAMSTGKRWRYSKLVLALGVVPKKLRVPGADLKNIYTLRVAHEANEIAEHAKGKRVVCIGGSLLAMEIAATLSCSFDSSVTVVCEKEEPLPSLGADIGAAVRKASGNLKIQRVAHLFSDGLDLFYPLGWIPIFLLLQRFQERGVDVLVNKTAMSFTGQDAVSGVVLKSGETLPADVVVVAVGVQPPTDWLRGTNVELDEDGFIKVDCNFKTTANNVYAIGDVVSAPLPLWNIDSINIQHLQTAQTHGSRLRTLSTGLNL